MKRTAFALMGLGMASLAHAETTHIDVSKLPSKTVYDVAQLTPLAVSAEGSPAVVLLALEGGDVVPPHAAKSGVRLLSVLKGELSWGDGSTIEEGKERLFSPGSILTIPAGADHWLAARSGDVVVQLVVLDTEVPVQAVQEQMK